jgi:hypothetical protein
MFLVATESHLRYIKILPDSFFAVKHLAEEIVAVSLRPLATEQERLVCHYPKLRCRAGCKLISVSVESA